MNVQMSINLHAGAATTQTNTSLAALVQIGTDWYRLVQIGTVCTDMSWQV
jgi:hypothetical protein